MLAQLRVAAISSKINVIPALIQHELQHLFAAHKDQLQGVDPAVILEESFSKLIEPHENTARQGTATNQQHCYIANMKKLYELRRDLRLSYEELKRLSN